MSELKPGIDLDVLARPATKLDPPRRWKTIYFLPVLIIVAFLLILFTSIGDLLREQATVTTIRPTLAKGNVARSGSVVLQAAGWIEPEPFAVQATALTTGVVAEVLVQESDSVEKGQVIARLIDTEKKLMLAQKEAQLQSAKAQERLAKVELDNAKLNFAKPITLEENLEMAIANDAAHEFECARTEASWEAQKAKVLVAKANLETQKYLIQEKASGPWQLELAQAQLAEESSLVEKMKSEALRSRAQMNGMKAKLKKARLDLELRLDDSLRLKNAEAMLVLKQALVAESKAAVDLARQHVAWTEVKAPVAGIVLARLAMPGSVVNEDKHGTSVCTLYDPKNIRLRVDVPQTDISKVEVGQKVAITSSARKEAYQGRVVRILDEANIQKVTLQVHVTLDSADALVKPEMLCQARFLATEKKATPNEEATVTLTVPKRLLVGSNRIWVVDPMGKTAKLKTISVGQTMGELVEVKAGINQSDKLIDRGREALSDGQTIAIAEEN